MFVLKLIGKFIKVLRSADTANQIAWGFACGAILGLTPLFSLHNIIVILLLFILKVNLVSALFGWLFFNLFAILLDPLFHSIGFFVLVKIPFLKAIWTILYNASIAPFSRFNNTVVMGSLLFSLVLLVPNYLFFRWFITRYRESWNEKVNRWKIVKIVRGSKIVKVYLKIRNWGD